MKISIILQFPDSERQAYIRAFSERQIDFFNEPEKAARCTISFAAVELKEHLSQCLENAEIAIRDAISDEVFVIRLFAKDLTIRGENYALIRRITVFASKAMAVSAYCTAYMNF